MKKNGFTLVELLAVIAILAMILGIVTINAINLSKKRREMDYDNIKKMMEQNAKTMVETSDTMADIIDTKQPCKITFNDLTNNGYMDSDTKNPTNDDSLSNTCVLITLNNYEYKYSFNENCISIQKCLN